MAKRGGRVSHKQWDSDVEQAFLFYSTIVANLNECYRNKNNSNFAQANNDVQELFNLVAELRKDLGTISSNATRYGLLPDAVTKKRQRLTDLQNKVASLRIAVNEGAGKTKPVDEKHNPQLVVPTQKGNAMAHQILEEQDKAKEMINEHVRVFDKLVQEVHKQVLNINDEVEQHNLVLDDLETAVNM
mmetsp:Transcript_4272/g.5006  ORF Transcript_4272/g.5006 Transcript_4272/m.5006 type:complete len:187 (+) Transcript_4272:430-990(+)